MAAGRWLRSWIPALCWAGVIWTLSTDAFSAERTSAYIEPILRWLRPSLTGDQIDAIHFFIRKAAHFTEYFIFSFLLFRGFRGEKKDWRWTWAVSAFALSAVYAMLDEIHQSFEAARTASAYDALLDSTGALVAMIGCWLWMRLRRPRPAPEMAPPDAPPA